MGALQVYGKRKTWLQLQHESVHAAETAALITGHGERQAGQSHRKGPEATLFR